MERTVFGGTNQADDLTSQITASFLRGWGIVGASEHPSLEDFNAAMYAMSQFIAYQHQMGVPEWHAEQEYHIGSICTHNGESYQSLQNANIGSQPPSAKWTPVLTSKNGLANLGLGEGSALPVGVPVPWPSATPPTGWLKCNGAPFSAEEYPELAKVYPTNELPDLRGEFIRGWDDGRGVDTGRGILSAQGDAIRNITGWFGAHATVVAKPPFVKFSAPEIAENVGGGGGSTRDAVKLDLSLSVPTASENRPRSIAFNYIVRAA
ncbi:tail fiber protein [Escherichia coli]|nr:tail fiber protein [Escherichia coli]MCK0673788.1 tail fiber protein [Escherichia coli]MCK0678303.1 tail fiber protein [Escherichia coli]MCK0691855.1 tail fiber protein [Escherichia coli]MCK0706031.1 tail fiber protein [Escherichia coli]